MHDITKRLSKLYLSKRITPSIIFWTSLYLATLVDSILVSHYYGAEGLTIASVFAPIITVWWIFAAGLGVAGSAMFARLQGNNQREEANKIASDFNGLTLITALLLGAIGLVVLPSLTQFLVNNNTVILAEAKRFGLWTILTTPVMIYASVLSDFAHADNSPKLAMTAIIVQNILNIIFDVLFMGVLDIGPQGASLSLFISTIATLLIVFTHYGSKDAMIRFRITLPGRKVVPQIFKYSYSAMLASTYDAITLIILNKLVLDTFGIEYATVFFMTTYTIYLTRGPYVGISSAVMPVQTAFLGGGNNKGAKLSTLISLRTCLIIVVTMVAVLIIYPEIISNLYNFNYPLLNDQCMWAIRIVALSLPFRAVNYIMYTSYIGVGHSAFSLFISTLRSFAIWVGVGYFAAKTDDFMLFICGALITESVTFIIWVVLAYIIKRRKNLDSLLMLPKEHNLYVDKKEFLLTSDLVNLHDYQKGMTEFLRFHELPQEKVNCAEHAIEEFIVYCTKSEGWKNGSYIYVEAFILKEKKLRLIARFDTAAEKIMDEVLSQDAKDDKFIGLRYLYNSSEKFVYNRVLGLNNIDVIY